MGGIFAQWQPRWAEAGVATFPVDIEGKKPAVGNPGRIGLPASRQLAARHGDRSALGFWCGPRSRLTILDIDAPDEKLLADAMAVVGTSPVIAQTASGKFHAYYLHNGERRSVRKEAARIGLTGPIDILGGGYCIAPPSSRGEASYEFIEGGLADFANLPAMRLPKVVQDDPAPALPSMERGEGVKEGSRSNQLFNACMRAAKQCHTLDALLAHARDLNTTYQPPLSDEETVSTAQSAWSYTVRGENRFGTRSVNVEHDLLDTLMFEDGQDAFFLYIFLRRHQWGNRFYVADELAPKMGWPRKRLAAARNMLLAKGRIVRLRRAAPNLPAEFSWPEKLSGGGEGGRGV